MCGYELILFLPVSGPAVCSSAFNKEFSHPETAKNFLADKATISFP